MASAAPRGGVSYRIRLVGGADDLVAGLLRVLRRLACSSRVFVVVVVNVVLDEALERRVRPVADVALVRVRVVPAVDLVRSEQYVVGSK